MIGRLLSRPDGAFGLAAAALLIGCAMLSLVWTPYDPLAVDPAASWQPFSFAHPLGTDSLGRDQVSALLVGARVTLFATVVATAIAAVLGVAIAFALALAPRTLSSLLERAVDVAIAFPTLIVAIILVTGFGASTWVAAVSIGLAASVVVARTVLPELRRALLSDHVLLATASGAGTWRIVSRHALPSVLPTLIVRLTQIMAASALAEAALSYLGFGTPPPTPSWGRSLSDLQSQIVIRPEYLIAPAVAIVIVVLGFNLLGDALRDVLDPRSRVTAVEDEAAPRPERKGATL
ncbi:ABC transporter permease [Microbacterium sp. Marseille-Q6965]|uniref:ABC transporter permease n=1 Tax=Microbacterium sp. Marseille-Q6965 TaxID=2965072 RepID=UPI0021B7BFCC|nr:ABC transporter permease [Microbacterium sp. Marseille-Q6965]